jgi:hypothetical protein
MKKMTAMLGDKIEIEKATEEPKMNHNDISNSVMGIQEVSSRLSAAVFGIQKIVRRKYTPSRHEDAQNFLNTLSGCDAGRDRAIKAVVGIGIHNMLTNYRSWAIDAVDAWVEKSKTGAQ